MTANDMNIITSAIQKLTPNQIVTLEELFPPDVWKSKAPGERKALGKEFLDLAIHGAFPDLMLVGKRRDNHLEYIKS